MKKPISFLLTMTSISFLAVACKETKQLENMHDNTAKMSDTTQRMATTTDGMAKTTEGMQKTTDGMAKTTDGLARVSGEMNEKMSNVVSTADQTYRLMTELYDAGRQAAGLDLRKKLWDSMAEEKKLDKKIVMSGEYYLAFEFAVWSGQGQDLEANRRDILAKDAVLEFFNHLKTISSWNSDSFWADAINPFAQPGKPLQSGDFYSSNETLNEKAMFNALSAGLHKTNRKQDFSASNAGAEVWSMAYLIDSALRISPALRSGEKKISEVPLYVDEVLKNEALAIRLMQARYNMLGLILLGRVTAISHSLVEGAKLKIFGMGWDLDLQKLNPSELKFYKAHLDEAAKVRTLLKDLKIPLEMNSSLKKIWSNARLLGMKSGVQTLDAEKAKADFQSALQAYLAN